MVDITTIPIENLKSDLLDSEFDISVCETALKNGIINYSGGLVADRLKDNQRFVEVITKELERRKELERSPV